MSSKQMSLILQPLSGGERTQIPIEGSLPTHRRRENRRVIATLAGLIGQPILSALCAVDAAECCPIWARNLSVVLEDHLERDSGSTSGSGPVDDRQLPVFGVES